MSTEQDVVRHYVSGTLLERLHAAMSSDGIDRDGYSVATLAPYDQFHGRGLEATAEAADGLEVAASDHLLDVGSGIGGPARYFAERFGCRVTGIDLTAEFCEAARELTRRLGMDGRVRFDHGNALAMPYAAETFDGAWSMNVSMNIEDKPALYREIHRVLAPGGWILLSELAQGTGPPPDYPTPWARSADTSFLSTPEQTRAGLIEAGFEVVRMRSALQEALAFGARTRAIVERGGKPPHRAVTLIHGEVAARAMANTARGLAASSIVPIEVLGRKRR